MTKEELEKQKWNDIFLEDCAVYDKKIAEEYTTLEEQIAKLKEENKELKEVHESDKRSLALIAKKGADFEKAYNEAEELLDKQIEATYKLFEENKELKEAIKHFNPCGEWDNDAHDCEFRHYSMEYGSKFTKAKEIIRELLFTSNELDENTRSKAEQFLKENN